MNEIDRFELIEQCSKNYILAVNDTLNVISGKWKLPIIASLFDGKKRFKELEDSIDKISPRMLSKELKELELNGIVNRNVQKTTPVLIEYELTESGHNLKSVIDAMVQWGLTHRHAVINYE